MTTLIEWFDAKVSRPGTSGEYWCIVNGNPYRLAYSRLHNAFNVCDNFDEAMAKTYALHASYWAHIPKEFKEI